MTANYPIDSINITISVPQGTTGHGNPHLLCFPPQWYNYFFFLAINYLAHACTVISLPGQTLQETVIVAIAALLFPMSGMSRAMAAIMGHAAFCSDPIQKAARAGALCMVAKNEPATPNPPKSHWSHHRQMDPNKQLIQIENSGLSVHGLHKCTLAPGWHLIPVPKSTSVSVVNKGDLLYDDLSTPRSVPKLFLSLLQAVWATRTLYRSQGDPIEIYGYAAFGLTVAQYAYMAIINIIGNLLQPKYTSMFIIRTEEMKKAEDAGCKFPDALEVKLNDSDLSEDKSPSTLQNILISLSFGLVPFVVVASLSRLKPQHSTPAQQLFTMLWLGLSIGLGPLLSEILVRSRHLGGEIPEKDWWVWVNKLLQKTIICVLGLCVLGIPFVGGVVVVMQMIHDFGICTRMY